MPRGRDLRQLGERGLADAALRHGHRADERGIVGVVGDEAQVGDDVLDLGALEVRLPARDRVRHVVRAERRLEHAGLVVAAVEDRVVAEAAAVLELVREEPRDDELRLGLVVAGGQHADRVAVAERAPQALLEQLRVVRDQRVGALQDAHAGTVVLLELHHGERRVVARQLREVLQRRAAPAVDRLVVVAHRGEARARAHQVAEQTVLRRVRVLVLVDQHVVEARLPALARLGVAVEQGHGQRDQVVEVDRTIGGERIAVAHVGTRGGDLGVVLRGGERCLRRDERVLPRADPPLRGTRAAAVGGGDELGDDALEVRGVEDREPAGQPERAGFRAHDGESERVERRDRALGRSVGTPLRAEELRRALAHLPCRLVGERDRGDAGWRGAALDQVRDLRGDDARLAAPGAGEHEQRTVDVADGLALWRIQRERHRGRCRGW